MKTAPPKDELEVLQKMMPGNIALRVVHDHLNSEWLSWRTDLRRDRLRRDELSAELLQASASLCNLSFVNQDLTDQLRRATERGFGVIYTREYRPR